MERFQLLRFLCKWIIDNFHKFFRGMECLTQKHLNDANMLRSFVLSIFRISALFSIESCPNIAANCNVLIVSICQPRITKDSIKSWIHRQKFATTKENATWPPSSLLKLAGLALVRYEQLRLWLVIDQCFLFWNIPLTSHRVPLKFWP